MKTIRYNSYNGTRHSRYLLPYLSVAKPLERPTPIAGLLDSKAMATAPSRAEVLSLLRSFLQAARKFSDYNIREYAARRAIDGFRGNKALSDPSAIAAAFADGMSQLEVAKRQAAVYSSYAPKTKSVMEVKMSPPERYGTSCGIRWGSGEYRKIYVF
ncbi:hypothetical protein B296_00024322 [Ensete ventricosum]|uniref:Complex 1 LYR protein domain-containing protein n=1 Tax=Ensete ventricosum TaxID=4639 RepID=A0A426YYE3_ENSVE|nr:hypothetical protein B296_00024322 [Ensete ventricosum]